jgi:hypothetical protein
MRRHLFSPGFGIENIMETHMLRCPGSKAHDSRNRGSSESMKSICCFVASSIEVPLLKGGGAAAHHEMYANPLTNPA